MNFTLTTADMMSSVLQSVNSDSGITQQQSYSAYGYTTRTKNNAALPGFNGERHDPLTGTSHLGNGYRAYNPTLMRFHCPDSMSPFDAGGINCYAYCTGDPINNSDPSGHVSKQALAGIGIGLSLIGLIGGGLAITAASANTAVRIAAGVGMVADAAGIISGVVSIASPEDSTTSSWVSLGAGIIGATAGMATTAFYTKNRLRSHRNKNLAPTNSFNKITHIINSDTIITTINDNEYLFFKSKYTPDIWYLESSSGLRHRKALTTDIATHHWKTMELNKEMPRKIKWNDVSNRYTKTILRSADDNTRKTDFLYNTFEGDITKGLMKNCGFEAGAFTIDKHRPTIFPRNRPKKGAQLFDISIDIHKLTSH